MNVLDKAGLIRLWTHIKVALNQMLTQAKESGEFKGDPGESMTVTNVSESTVDGGENVVTFSDGSTLKVKNGNKGEFGAAGLSIGTIESVPEINPDGALECPHIWMNDRAACVGDLVLCTSNGNIYKVTNASMATVMLVEFLCNLEGDKGDAGDPITITNVSESTVSGYNNVVTFSDGTTLTVKNGLPGENGYSIYSNSTEPMINPDGDLEYNSTDAELLDARTGDFVLCTSNYTLYKIIGETAEAFFVQALCNLKGADGVGIKSVTQTTTSTVDGGSNVVTVTKTDNATSTFTVKNGTKGSRGTGILKVTTAPASYTTAVGGYTPKYRMALSTIKTQSGVSEVFVGDVIQYSYYQYHIGYIDESYAYIANTRTSLRGAAGAAGTTPVKGTDYFTEADKTEMVNATKASMPTFTLVGTDVNDVTHTYILYGYNSGE